MPCSFTCCCAVTLDWMAFLGPCTCFYSLTVDVIILQLLVSILFHSHSSLNWRFTVVASSSSLLLLHVFCCYTAKYVKIEIQLFLKLRWWVFSSTTELLMLGPHWKTLHANVHRQYTQCIVSAMIKTCSCVYRRVWYNGTEVTDFWNQCICMSPLYVEDARLTEESFSLYTVLYLLYIACT